MSSLLLEGTIQLVCIAEGTSEENHRVLAAKAVISRGERRATEKLKKLELDAPILAEIESLGLSLDIGRYKTMMGRRSWITIRISEGSGTS